MDNTGSIVLIIALFIIMMGMGLSLTLDDFKRVLKYPLAVFIGFLNQIILLPVIAYVIIAILEVDSNIAMGAIILAACPGGPTSNLITYLAKGDTALSVTLTAVNSIITIITIPLIVNFGLSEYMSDASFQIDAPIGKIAGSLFIVVAIPLAIGMLVKKYSSSFALKMSKPVRITSALVLALVIIGLMVKERSNLATYFENALTIALIINIATMLIGYFIAKTGKLNFKQSLSISIESGNQNGTLAIHVAVVSLAMPEFAIVAAVYSLIMFLTALVPIIIGNYHAKQQPG